MDFEKWMLLFPHGYLSLAGPTRNQLEFFNLCGRGAVCEPAPSCFHGVQVPQCEKLDVAGVSCGCLGTQTFWCILPFPMWLLGV